VAPKIIVSKKKTVTSRVQEPITGEVQLSPTAAYTVADLTQMPAAPVTAQPVSGHIIWLTETELSPAHIENTFADLGEFTTESMTKATDVISALIGRIEVDTKVCLVVDTRLTDFPAMELAFAIRGIETAFGQEKVQIVFYGQDPKTWQTACRQLSPARHAINRSTEPEEALVQAILKTF
jgi:hypothetical protein